MDIRERIQYIVTVLFDGSRRSFALKIGIVPGTVDNVLGVRASKPSVEMLEKIMDKIEGMNAEWLLTGKGEMKKYQSDPNPNSDIGYTEKIAMSAMAEKIARLEKENFELRNELGHEERRAV